MGTTTAGNVRIRLVNASTVSGLSLLVAAALVTQPAPPTLPVAPTTVSTSAVAVRVASSYVEAPATDTVASSATTTAVSIAQGTGSTLVTVATVPGTVVLTKGSSYTVVVAGDAGSLRAAIKQDNN